MKSEILFDIDGNKYNTVKIGDQTWMSENLKVSHFRNGDKILLSKNRRECELHIRSESAVYISEDDPTNYIKYGFLYTPHAIFDERGLAPEGWRIPSLEDWETLVNFLGGKEIAGRKLKSQTGWKRETDQPSTYKFRPCEFGGTNETGFSALPSGRMQTIYQKAYDVGMYAWYWATDKKKVGDRITWYSYFNLNYYKGNVSYGCTFIKDYLAIRCVKN